MRRMVVIFCVAVLLGLLVGPVSADTDPGGPSCDGICRTTGKVKSATAVFSAQPDLVPGHVSVDAFLYAEVSTRRIDGTRVRSTYVALSVSQYTVAETGEYISISDSFGEAEGSAVQFAIATRLRSAALKASIRMTNCVPGDGEPVCVEAPRASTLAVTWTATGGPVWEASRFHRRTAGQNIVGSFQGWTRQAAALASLDGSRLSGLVYGDIRDAQQQSLVVDHLGE